MKSAHREASQHKRMQHALLNNPIAIAVHRKRAKDAECRATEEDSRTEEEFQDQLILTRTRLLMAANGEDATELLASLAVVIGIPCEAGARQYGRENTPWVRQLHGALRTIQAMCLDGYKWRSEHALALNRAVVLATDESHGLERENYMQAWAEVAIFSNQISRHEVSRDSIADPQQRIAA